MIIQTWKTGARCKKTQSKEKKKKKLEKKKKLLPTLRQPNHPPFLPCQPYIPYTFPVRPVPKDAYSKNRLVPFVSFSFQPERKSPAPCYTSSARRPGPPQFPKLAGFQPKDEFGVVHSLPLLAWAESICRLFSSAWLRSTVVGH
jgi:hypothetical protein